MYLRVCFAAVSLAALTTAPARADNYARFLPSNTRAVYVINVGVLSEADQKQAAEIVRQVYGFLTPELKDLDKIPISDLKRVVVAQPYAGDMRGVVLLRCKVDAALLEKQMQAAAKANPKAVKIEKLGKQNPVSVFSRPLDDKELQKVAPGLKRLDDLGPLLANTIRLLMPSRIHAAALDDETLMISLSGSAPIERALGRRPAKSEPAVTAELKKLLDGLSEKDVGSVVLMEECLAPGLRTAGPKEIDDWFSRFEHAVARFEAGKTIKMTLTAKCKSKGDAGRFEKDTPAASKRLLELLAKVMPEDQHKGAKGLFDLLKVAHKDDVVTITGELSEEDARRLFPVPEKK